MISRRHLLATAAVLVAGGVGAAVGLLRPTGDEQVAAAGPPVQLTTALAREQDLLAALELALRHDPALQGRLRQVRADHAAHAGALRSAIAGYPAASPTSQSASPPAGVSSLAELRKAELAAARLAAAESADLTAANAALLASISAAESTHAELLA